MAISSNLLESDLSLLKAISKAKMNKEVNTEVFLRQFRKEMKLAAPQCLVELRNRSFVGSGDYIVNKDGDFLLCSANGQCSRIDIEYVYEFCRGRSQQVEDNHVPMKRVK
ncbi:hypothetical protein [Pontibacillus litoralis]|uniref:Uncharacterized protein n=1 Tax=Pontibacillus litoralis JSM 072002 TaxID=1385512 RepID=A0A0A5GAW7_9BACI|nr:hypothetical protein [Pontibacillus litoralis]KGX88260.1 hypothetical protein N784_10395 [Pontibacillus litoralis JSM 072002]